MFLDIVATAKLFLSAAVPLKVLAHAKQPNCREHFLTRHYEGRRKVKRKRRKEGGGSGNEAELMFQRCDVPTCANKEILLSFYFIV